MSEVVKIKIKEIRPGKNLSGQYGDYQQVWIISDKDIWYSATASPSLAEDLGVVKTWKVGQEIEVECKTASKGDKTYRNIKPVTEKAKASSEVLTRLDAIDKKLEVLTDMISKAFNEPIGKDGDINF